MAQLGPRHQEHPGLVIDAAGFGHRGERSAMLAVTGAS
jgi:hypothetical protein